MLVSVNDRAVPLAEALVPLIAAAAPIAPERFTGRLRELVTGEPQEAAKGLPFYMLVADAELYARAAAGVAAIEREFAEHGRDEDKECLAYVLHAAAGSSAKLFPNSPYPRDCDASGLRADRTAASGDGKRLADFGAHPNAVTAGLRPEHVLAIRLYSTAAFKSINEPLRERGRTVPHPFPATVHFLAEALKRLRTVTAGTADAHDTLDLWRGMAHTDLKADAAFFRRGGTELAPMSTTADAGVAVAYAASARALVFKVRSTSFMDRGADISWCSAFPAEKEYLYPPLTYLKPTGRREVVQEGATELQVVEVAASIGS